MPFTIIQDAAQPPQAAQEAAALLTDLLGEDDDVSPLSARARRRVRIDQMLRAEARIDAALELIALRLPRWSLRRLAYDDGEWHCALSQQRDMPDWLDQCAEATHSDLSLAILHAAVEAERLEQSALPSPGKRLSEPMLTELICCDNF
ncbi:conserved protein of unknown function [Bradyrhizobium sp. ORS 285]|uniref:hypothetical protein n=1 Tax=Bradyrhizobium sp. ORS 285 TaxID=115808 RepID=UPI0002409AD4|nr:hypothetical protein [Bradyrhizobium sp. ORS 285]CCD88693.1 conserved hypothetical protein [Bradyrhizobium sp. ORS 285]SMX56659.1 conserved protein of unknown function [Bradyrhizobium sp. ORS 285]